MLQSEFKSKVAGEVRRVPGTPPYEAFFPSPTPSGITLSHVGSMKLSESDRALGRLVGVGQVLPNPHLVSNAYRRREAVSSLAIEGTQTTLRDVLAQEAMDVSGTPAILEVVNYVHALDYGFERLASLPISLRLVRELHERLMVGVRGQERRVGAFRNDQNWIGPADAPIDEAHFVPPPPAAMRDALVAWESHLHEPSPKDPPLVRCALMHYQFETIHPFGDGNGRLSRLLVPLFLAQHDLLPLPLLFVSPYLERHRNAYVERLQAVRQLGDFEGWIVFFLDAIRAQAIDAVERAEALLGLLDSFRKRMVDAKIRSGALRLVDSLLENPFMTKPRAMMVLDVSHQGATYAVNQLVELRILDEQRSRGPGGAKQFVASEVLEILAQ